MQFRAIVQRNHIPAFKLDIDHLAEVKDVLFELIGLRAGRRQENGVDARF